MTELKSRPTEGQWVEVWEYDGVIWSHVFKMIDGNLHMFNPISDNFVKLKFYYPRDNTRYFQSGG